MSILSQRTLRERVLIYSALGLFGVFAVWQFAVNPVIKGKLKAEIQYASAAKDLDVVRTGLSRLSSRTEGVARNRFDRASIIGTASEMNIPLSRVQPGREGAVEIWFEDSSSTAIFAFLSRLTQQYSVDISRVQMNRRFGGVVSAQITLTPAP